MRSSGATFAEAGLLAAVGDGVINAPVGLGVASGKGGGSLGTILHPARIVIICFQRVVVRLIVVVAAVIAAGAPAEQVYPATVTLADLAVVVAYISPLLFGETPGVRGGLLLQVAL